jgi:hypothetical protein
MLETEISYGRGREGNALEDLYTFFAIALEPSLFDQDFCIVEICHV